MVRFSALTVGLLFLCACSEEEAPKPPEPVGAVPSAPAPSPTPARTVARAARAEARREPPGERDDSGLDSKGTFFGEPDHAIRVALLTQPVASIEKGRGGRSLAFKITLADGTKGYYKPEQSFSGAHYYGELASYYLDRALGLGRVPPTVGRRMDWAPLEAAAQGDARIAEVAVDEDRTVRGAFIWWVPGGLEPLRLGRHFEKWIRQHGGLDLTPYQRPANWRAALKARSAEGAEEEEDGRGDEPETVRPMAGEPDTPDRPAELSDLILFDYLTGQVDRWGGNFTNVRTRGKGGPLVFLDNGASFYPRLHRTGLTDARLHVLERFRRSTVEAIEALTREDLEALMNSDPLAPVLDDNLLEGLEVRRKHLLEHVARMRKRYGDGAVFF